MSIFKPCVNARPTRSMRCECGYQTCLGCSEFVNHTMEHEPTGHAWIKTTNKYYKRSHPGRYEKGIITFGCTYEMCIMYKRGLWVLDVLVDMEYVLVGAECLKIAVAIEAGSGLIKHLIAADNNRKPRQLRAEDAPRVKHLAVARPAGTPA